MSYTVFWVLAFQRNNCTLDWPGRLDLTCGTRLIHKQLFKDILFIEKLFALL